MKLRNLLLGSICAATLALGGCEKAEINSVASPEKAVKSVVYTPLKANITGDESHPIDNAIRYDAELDLRGRGFSLHKETDKYTISLSFRDGHYVSLDLYNKAKGTLSLKDYLFNTLIDPKEHTDYKGVDVISNSNGTECAYWVPCCSGATLEKGSEIFLLGLNEMRFREHLWHFINSPDSTFRDPLDGWE